MNRIPGLVALLLSATAVAADYESIAPHAYEQLETNISEGWSYIARHEADRGSGERWRLIEVDGHVPTEKEASEFTKRKQASDNEGADNNNEGDKLFESKRCSWSRSMNRVQFPTATTSASGNRGSTSAIP